MFKWPTWNIYSRYTYKAYNYFYVDIGLLPTMHIWEQNGGRRDKK